MKRIALFLFAAAALFGGVRSIGRADADPGTRREELIRADFDRYRAIYEDIHRHPELSGHESRTAHLVADELRYLGVDTTEGVGGVGVVGVLRNGTGPVILVRTEMDALPIQETTNLPYASENAGVMHACGHDLHVASLLATAHVLSATKDLWHGTIVFVGQPAEETISGARAMIADGLFTRFPKPDAAIALHVIGMLPAGLLAYHSGFAMAASDSIDVEFIGRDAHGSTPHLSIDPIVMGAEFTLKTNAIAAREVDPQDPVVITVGSFHAGSRYNIIPERAHLQLTVRSFDENTRAFLKRRIAESAKDIAAASRAPQPPMVSLAESVAATYNDPALLQSVLPVFKDALGENRVVAKPASMGAEDFSEFSRLGDLPGLMFWIGATDPSTPEPWPSNHTAKFSPDFVHAWPAAVRAMSAAVTALLQPAPHAGRMTLQWKGTRPKQAFSLKRDGPVSPGY